MGYTAFLFPGQGSQTVGMGEDLFNDSRVNGIYETADEIMGTDFRELILNGPEERLNRTSNAQPAIFTDGVARYRVLQDEGIFPDYMLGHSLGEFSALTAAGCLTFEEGLKIVRKRGELTSEVDVEGSMVAVMGVDYSVVERVIENVGDSVTVANHNSPSQVVISGKKEPLDKSCEKLREERAKCIKLDVTGPFHSSYMKGPEKELKDYIDQFEFEDPEVPVLSGVSGSFEDDGNHLKELLGRQMTHSVRWVDYVNLLGNADVKRTIEVGPDATLSRLTGKIDSSIERLRFDEVI
jgi:[acyl-carrier-protein] S-malonyltransferase